MSDAQARSVYDAARIGQRITLGERPAVLVVDFSCGFTDPACALGSDLSEAVGATAELLRLARELGVPVIFTTIAFGSSLADGGLWLQKMPALADLQIGGQWVEMQGPLLRIGSTDPADVQYLLDALRGAGMTIRRVQLLRPTLEELFIDVMAEPGGAVSGRGAA